MIDREDTIMASRISEGSGRADTSGVSVLSRLVADPDNRDAGIEAGMLVVRSDRAVEPRPHASTADDGTTGIPVGGYRSIGSSLEDSARGTHRRYGAPTLRGTRTTAGVAIAAKREPRASDETERVQGNQ
jgi:hypothetical protein